MEIDNRKPHSRIDGFVFHPFPMERGMLSGTAPALLNNAKTPEPKVCSTAD